MRPSGRFRAQKLVCLNRHSKCFFAYPQCSCVMASLWQHAHASARGMPARSGRAGEGASPAARNNAATAGSWPMPSSTTRWPVGLEQLGRLSRNGAIAGEAIGAAVERAARIVPDLGGQRGDVAARDIGRIADHEIEGAGERRAEIAGREFRARGKAEAAGVVARGRERLAADVGADADGVRQLAQAARAAARPSRCRDRRCAARGCADRRRRSRQAPPRRRFRSPAAAPAWLR